jgi:ATP-dependent helicase HrpA
LDQLADFPEYLPGWGVPGLLEERVYLLVRSLPKSQRQACSPARDMAQAFVEEWQGWEPTRELRVELADYLSRRCGHVIEAGMFDEDRLPENMRPKIRVWGDGDEELACCESAEEIRQSLAEMVREKREVEVNEEWEMTGGEGWDFGAIPEVVDDEIFPALLDEGETVGMRAYLNKSQADESHRAGCVRLFRIDQASQCDYVRKKFPLGMEGKLMLPVMETHRGEAIEQMLGVACEGALGIPLPRDEQAFRKASDAAKGELFQCAEKVARGFEQMCEIRGRVAEWMEQQRDDRHLHVVVEDLDEEMDWLTGSGFIWRAGYERMRDYDRYFQAMEERLKRLQSLPQVKDDEKRERVQGLWGKWYAAWKNDPDDVRLWSAGWLLMEWRVAEFAPGLPRLGKVSQKRIQTIMDDLDIG